MKSFPKILMSGTPQPLKGWGILIYILRRRGHPLMTSHKFGDFLTPFPPLSHCRFYLGLPTKCHKSTWRHLWTSPKLKVFLYISLSTDSFACVLAQHNILFLQNIILISIMYQRWHNTKLSWIPFNSRAWSYE